MKTFAFALIVAARAGLAIVGAVALYLVIYGGAGWLSDAFGYDSSIGHAFGMVNGALSPLAFGFTVIPLFAIALFWVLSKVAFKGKHAA
jgi:hypothetical protein